MLGNLKKGLTSLIAILIWSTFQIIAQDTPVDDAQPLWQLSFNVIPGDPIVNPRQFDNVLYGEKVILYLQNDHLYSVDVENGKTLWQIDYSLITFGDSANLPDNGDGLVYVPKDNTVQALDEYTGQEVWKYASDEPLDEIIEETVNNVGIDYEGGYIFAQTKSYIVCLNALTGEVLWKQEKFDRQAREYKVLNDDFLKITTMKILEKRGTRPGAWEVWQGIYRLKTGELLWRIKNNQQDQEDKIINSNLESVDILTSFSTRDSISLDRYNLETGEIIKSCPLPPVQDNRIGSIALSLIRSALVWDTLMVENGGLFSRPDYEVKSTEFNILRIPFCMEGNPYSTPPAEILSKDLDRYLLSSVLYYDTRPFIAHSGPYNGFFLFEAYNQLYKVPVPKESFTYLYHDKSNDLMYIAPTFNTIYPSPYERIPNFNIDVDKLKLIKVELIDGKVFVLFSNGTFQIIDFESLETVLKTQTHLNIEVLGEVTFHTLENVVILSNLTQNKQDLMAFPLE